MVAMINNCFGLPLFPPLRCSQESNSPQLLIYRKLLQNEKLLYCVYLCLHLMNGKFKAASSSYQQTQSRAITIKNMAKVWFYSWDIGSESTLSVCIIMTFYFVWIKTEAQRGQSIRLNILWVILINAEQAFSEFIFDLSFGFFSQSSFFVAHSGCFCLHCNFLLAEEY